MGLRPSGPEGFNITADNGRAWQLNLIAEANQKLKMQIESREPEHKDH